MASTTMAIIVLIGGFFLLMAFKVPVTFAMLISTIASTVFVPGTNPTTMVRMMIDGVSNFTMLAIPFFIVMGEIMAAGQISDKIVDLANLAVGRFRGGLAYVNCLDSMFFGGISGSAVADVSSLGSVVIPMMVKQGYDREFTVGLTVTTACQGVLIPPSHNMVIYALAAGGGVSIGQLFYAGFAPGICLGLGFMLMCLILGKKYNFPKGEKMFKNDRVRWIKFKKHDSSVKHGKMAEGEGWISISLGAFDIEMGKCMQVVVNAILPMFTLIIILVGTGAGVFTATESSAVACFYTFILTYFIFRADKLKNFGKVIKNSLKTLAVVLTLIATAKAFAYMMTRLRIPAAITNGLIGFSDNPYVIFLIINILLLILGCFMDMAPLIMIMTPILLPVVTELGMSPIHFGIVLIFNLAIGLCTPPVGSALFVGCAVGKTSLENTAKKMLPLFFVMVALLLVFTYLPYIAKIPLFGY
ncbi:MAG: TRAP transporter large permease [Spirochaetes bacterium]|uniref:TRAP transporter large permease n=1 Tax=Candidatus Ornithospirochaeta stercoravium TaxID=2840897 RepID=A0A9D9IC66_9SPIO|nr:TRAP transporter large permease [Candidatus Ornithospirochaeta stercoravium]